MSARFAQIILTRHARIRLRERAITLDQVRSVIRSPEISYPDRLTGREVGVKPFGNRKLRVVFARRQDDIFVITAVWSEGAES